MQMHRIVAAIATLVMGLPATGSAQSAGAIVYVRENNVWVTTASGVGAHAVTHDGGYGSPSLADDGTIGVLRHAGREALFVRVDQTGRVLSSFSWAESPSLLSFARISPNGRLFAFEFAGTCAGFSTLSAYTLRPCTRTLVTASDRWAAVDTTPRATSEDRGYPSWLGSARVLLAGPGNRHGLQAYTLGVTPGAGGLQGYFTDDGGQIGMAEVSRDGRNMVAVRRQHGVDNMGNDHKGLWEVVVYASDPTRKVELRARHVGVGAVSTATISPEGRFIAFADGEGLKVAAVAAARATVVDRFGKEPSWGAFAASQPALEPSASTPTDAPVAPPPSSQVSATPLRGASADALTAVPVAEPGLIPSTMRDAPAQNATSLTFPPKRRYKNHAHVHQRYDKFSDTSSVSVTITHSPGLLQSLYKTTVYADLAVTFAGQMPSTPPEPVTMVVRLSDLSSVSTLGADSAKKKAQAAGATQAKVAFVVDDTARFAVDATPLGVRVVPWGDSTGVFRIEEAVRVQLPIGTLLRLANAGRRVDARWRTTTFSIVSDELDALRDFASRLAPVAAATKP